MFFKIFGFRRESFFVKRVKIICRMGWKICDIELFFSFFLICWIRILKNWESRLGLDF